VCKCSVASLCVRVCCLYVCWVAAIPEVVSVNIHPSRHATHTPRLNRRTHTHARTDAHIRTQNTRKAHTLMIARSHIHTHTPNAHTPNAHTHSVGSRHEYGFLVGRTSNFPSVRFTNRLTHAPNNGRQARPNTCFPSSATRTHTHTHTHTRTVYWTYNIHNLGRAYTVYWTQTCTSAPPHALSANSAGAQRIGSQTHVHAHTHTHTHTRIHTHACTHTHTHTT